jgi:ribosomal protein S12 methylthiotransferase
VRTTFISGFPGETEKDYEELLSFIKNVEFDRVGVFTYSDEEGTPAYELSDKVQHRTAARRRNALMKEQAKISRRKNKARVGDVVQVLFEGESK